MSESVYNSLKQKFGDAILVFQADAVDPWIEVAPDALFEVCRFLKDTHESQFNLLNCISGVDYFHTDPKKQAKAGWDPHLEVVYHLSSISTRQMLVLKVKLPRWKDDQEGQLPELDSVSSLWSTADWHEREVFDLCGVKFTGHPNLRRILCPEDWIGHPLRKDYEMPLEYHGIRGR
jgi:NADH-quinone oxidoreductase subunit C